MCSSLVNHDNINALLCTSSQMVKVDAISFLLARYLLSISFSNFHQLSYQVLRNRVTHFYVSLIACRCNVKQTSFLQNTTKATNADKRTSECCDKPESWSNYPNWWYSIPWSKRIRHPGWFCRTLRHRHTFGTRRCR